MKTANIIDDENAFNECYRDFVSTLMGSIGLEDLEVSYNDTYTSIDVSLSEIYGNEYENSGLRWEDKMAKYLPYELLQKSCQDIFGKPYQLLDTMERWVRAESACYGRDCHYWTEEVGDYNTYFLDNLAFLFMEWWVDNNFAHSLTAKSGELFWLNLAQAIITNLFEWKQMERENKINTILK